MDYSFIDMLSHLHGAKDGKAAWHGFKALCQKYGVRYVTYLRAEPSRLDTESIHYRIDMDEEWITHYMDNNYVAHDPAVLHAFSYKQPFMFDRNAAVDTNLTWTDTQVTLSREAQDFGLGSGFVIPCFSYRGTLQGSITLFAEHGDVEGWEVMQAHAERLMLNALLLHQWYSKEGDVLIGDSYKLSPRQREVIQWMKTGLSNELIAEKMGIAENTVSFHLTDIRRLLGVRSRREILAKAYAYDIQ
ncbi:LuxR family transcriptional regulator [Kordiimonas pumila]|uniref:LuxR family transcriptional regulator n=1 Tax=Kordiimonas pumila TaxID=2161677 RepID=A0ABV7DAE0_9PROT|nr:LuxR family transcriptional regulator [Kordiimonas pumila]